MCLGYSVTNRVWLLPSSALLFCHLLHAAKKQLEALGGRLLGGRSTPKCSNNRELLRVCFDVLLAIGGVPPFMAPLSCLLMVALDVLFWTKGKRQLSDGFENLKKSVANVAKSGPELRGRRERGATSGAAFPPCEFGEHSTASAVQGDATRAHFSNFIHKLCQPQGKLRDARSRPSSRSAIGLQLCGGETVVWPKPEHPRPFSSPRSPPVPERSAPLAPGGRRETPDRETCGDEPQAAGLPSHRSGTPGQS